MTNMTAIRGLFVLLALSAGAFLAPDQDQKAKGAIVGAAVGIIAVSLETWFRRASALSVLGGTLGALAAFLALWLLAPFLLAFQYSSIVLAAIAVFLYLGLTLGSAKGESIRWAIPSTVVTPADRPAGFKILDTSVIIDGRIADICETGFLDGALVIPQFVLRELQLVADSADSLKRNRGRRGLDILQRLQKLPNLQVKITEEDFPNVRDVDMKLIELAKAQGSQIVTNDFNLNKVAQLRGVQVLNINELANALKPVVLPGEIMRVFILKEGKEYNQGVAYLDDGTMVVVDNARRLISKTIDITVTSVLQTTAGKMIFGRYDERQHAIHERMEPKAERQHQTVTPPSV